MAGGERGLPPGIAAACRLAEQLGSARGVAMLAFLLAETYTDADDPDEVAIVLDGAIAQLEAIERREPTMRELTDRLLARWMRVRQGDRAPQSTVHGATGAEAEELAGIGDALADIQLAIEARALRRGSTLRARTVVRSADDVAWNAVLARRDLQLEDIDEAVDLARRVTSELVDVGALDIEVPEDASVCLAGLLQWLWDAQNLVSLQPEIAVGQAGAVLQLVQLLAAPEEDWASWREQFRPLEDELERLLAEIDALPYDETLYVHINALPDQVTTRAREAIASVADEDLSVAGTWVLGYLMARNTFSWMDGSVPEAIHDRLERARSDLATDAEGWFMPLLAEGFRAVREQVPDELDRWRT